MNQWTHNFSRKKALLISSIVSVALFTLLFTITLNEINRNRQKEILMATENYIDYQRDLEYLINSNISLMSGYLAYLKTNGDLDKDLTVLYLDNLLVNNEGYVRNIATLKNTTIIWNYPPGGNESSIGVDLATIDGQKKLVLGTKIELKPSFAGPVDLVQGGKGFIVRLPVVRDDTGYWGQISVVLDADKVFEALDIYAKDATLDVAIYHEDLYPEEPFLGDTNMSNKNPLVFQIKPELMDWRIEVIPVDGWKTQNISLILWSLGSLVIAFIVGMVIFLGFKTNYELKQSAIHDGLTMLLNRHFLDEYQELITTAAIRRDSKIGMLLMDLDKFKNINDDYGHRIGDMVLIEVARVLKKTSRTNEAVFRLGGDEFLIVYPEVEDYDALMKARLRIIRTFEEEFHIKGYDIKLVPSIGGGIFPDHGHDFDEVMHHADHEMYIEKSKHKENDNNQMTED